MREEQESALAAGEHPALFGAKITGGGCGGESGWLWAVTRGCQLGGQLLTWRCLGPEPTRRACGGAGRALMSPCPSCCPSPCAGTVCVLGRADKRGEAALSRVVARYAEENRHAPKVFSGSSAGASAFGSLRLQRRGVQAAQ